MRMLILLLVLAVAGCTAVTPEAGAPSADRAESAGELWRGVDFSCSSDADCGIKNLGNCCGYYPACVNRASPSFPERVQAQCQAEGLSSVCGFPELTGCTCIEGRCQGVSGGGGELR
jgi:hypothetical protein